MHNAELHRLGRSVARAGAHLRVIHIPHIKIGRAWGFGAKILCLYDVTGDRREDDLICMVDGFDVLTAWVPAHDGVPFVHRWSVMWGRW